MLFIGLLCLTICLGLWSVDRCTWLSTGEDLSVFFCRQPFKIVSAMACRSSCELIDNHFLYFIEGESRSWCGPGCFVSMCIVLLNDHCNYFVWRLSISIIAFCWLSLMHIVGAKSSFALANLRQSSLFSASCYCDAWCLYTAAEHIICSKFRPSCLWHQCYSIHTQPMT